MRPILALLTAVILAACSGSPDEASMPPPNTLTPEERAAGFELLFDGETTEGWHVFKEEGTPGWDVVDGALSRVAPGGDLVTDRAFGDFELRLQWKVEPGGNSGILFRIDEESERTFHSAPEMQILDDAAHADGASRLTSAGANYGLHPAPEGVVRPAGEWNEVRLIADGPHVEHWLNGRKIVEYELWSDEWREKVAASKFSQWPEYGMSREGPIGLQDHGDRVFYRSIRIRTLGEGGESGGGR